MRKLALLLVLTAGVIRCYAQHTTALSPDAWVDSVFRTLTPDDKITQLMVIRLSAIDPVTRRAVFYDPPGSRLVKPETCRDQPEPELNDDDRSYGDNPQAFAPGGVR